MNENGAFTTAITTKRTKAPNASLRCRAFAGITVIEVAKSTRDPERWSPIEVFCNMSEPRCKHSTQALGQEKLRTVHALAGWFRQAPRDTSAPPRPRSLDIQHSLTDSRSWIPSDRLHRVAENFRPMNAVVMNTPCPAQLRLGPAKGSVID